MKKRKLKNIGVLITRPIKQSQELRNAIHEHGGNPILFPVIDIKPLSPVIIKHNKEQLDVASIIIFVSINAAINGKDHFDFTNKKVIAIGPTTKNYLERNDITVTFCPEKEFNSEGLLQSSILKNVKNKIITIVRGESGRESLNIELDRRGAKVQYLTAYKRVEQSHTKEQVNDLNENFQSGIIHFVIIMSFETFKYLSVILNSKQVQIPASIKFIVPSQRVANKIHAYSENNTCIVSADTQTSSIISVLEKNTLA